MVRIGLLTHRVDGHVGLLVLAVSCIVTDFVAASHGASQTPTEDRIVADKGTIFVHPIQHATFVLRYKGLTIYVDPVGGRDRFKEFPAPELILITDIHGDHADRKTVEAVRKEGTTIVAPPAVANLLAGIPRVQVLENGETTEIAGVKIEAIPMYNITPDRMKFHPKGRGNGYVVTLGGKRIYISGDTEDIQEMRQLKAIDAAFVCMNLPFTMTVEQAADAVLEFKPKIVYPYHYRGREGFSDVGKFKELVSKDPSLEVRLLNWYPEK
jgi:L-ascorbate metabolism protein UlaG (beta-lactamase superfamily)